MMRFVIKATHKLSAESVYFCAIPIDCIPFEHRVDPDADFQNYVTHSIAEAQEFPFPSVEIATAYLVTLRNNTNFDYEILEVATDQDVDLELFQEPQGPIQ